MSDYNIFPAVNRDLEFPPGIRAKLAQAEEMKKTYAHLEDGKLVIDGKVVAAAAGSGGTVGGGVTYGLATDTQAGIVEMATITDFRQGTSGALAVGANLLNNVLADKIQVGGSFWGGWAGTQAEYDALTPQPKTLYFVVSAGN